MPFFHFSKRKTMMPLLYRKLRKKLIFPDYISAVNELPAKKRKYLAVAIVGFVNEHLEFFRCLKRNHLDYMIIDFFDNHLLNGRDRI